MKKMIAVAVLGLVLFSCGDKKDLGRDGMTHEEVENLEENSVFNAEQINYEGTFKGKILDKEIELKITDDKFEVQENGKKAFGEWSKVDDGSIIELIPSSGRVNVKHYAYSDENTWVALTDSLTYIEPEQYLQRVK